MGAALCSHGGDRIRSRCPWTRGGKRQEKKRGTSGAPCVPRTRRQHIETSPQSCTYTGVPTQMSPHKHTRVPHNEKSPHTDVSTHRRPHKQTHTSPQRDVLTHTHTDVPATRSPHTHVPTTRCPHTYRHPNTEDLRFPPLSQKTYQMKGDDMTMANMTTAPLRLPAGLHVAQVQAVSLAPSVRFPSELVPPSC